MDDGRRLMTARRRRRLQEAFARFRTSADFAARLRTSAREEEITSALPGNLDELPRLRGFRLRGIEMTRLETFIDAAFAFAVTVMVIAGERAPGRIPGLLGGVKNCPGVVASVGGVGIFLRGALVMEPALRLGG